MKMKFGVLAGTIVAVTMAFSGQAMADSDAEQLARMADPDQWPAPGRDFAMTRHSTLSDINTKNINKLQM
ncbi:MAG: PQQ-dependent dehydrogenase, methanol/ethanol family, partial [Methyloceanibacter sp.]